VHRISVVGPSGSGKSTVAAALARRLQVRHVELDAIYHQPGWTPLPAEEFRSRLEPIVATDRWVVDGNYSMVNDLVWGRADTVVWLDLPRPAVMRQLFARTAVRAISRRELWNGNREPLTGMLRWQPERSILRWSWTTHDEVRQRYTDAIHDPSHAHLEFVRLRTRSEVTRWLAEVASP
jgi:adenylate kinase family enzyme